MITKLNNKNKGFTLIELLVFIGLFSILLLVLTQMFVSIMEAQLNSQASSGTSQDSRYILNRIMYDIHRADNLNSPTTLGASAASLSLQIGGNSYIYTQVGDNLILRTNSNDYQLNSFDTTISNLQFQRLGSTSNPALIKVIYTIKSDIQKTSGPEETKIIETVIGLRLN
jgi:prepilin-type N-terminal cleavage/methylation domain-containing protein